MISSEWEGRNINTGLAVGTVLYCTEWRQQSGLTATFPPSGGSLAPESESGPVLNMSSDATPPVAAPDAEFDADGAVLKPTKEDRDEQKRAHAEAVWVDGEQHDMLRRRSSLVDLVALSKRGRLWTEASDMGAVGRDAAVALKEQGNAAFKAGDLARARALYTHAVNALDSFPDSVRAGEDVCARKWSLPSELTVRLHP